MRLICIGKYDIHIRKDEVIQFCCNVGGTRRNYASEVNQKEKDITSINIWDINKYSKNNK